MCSMGRFSQPPEEKALEQAEVSMVTLPLSRAACFSLQLLHVHLPSGRGAAARSWPRLNHLACDKSTGLISWVLLPTSTSN